jgi:hypothetical protein
MGVIFRAGQRHFRRIVAVKRVLGYHRDSPRKKRSRRAQGWIIPTSFLRPDI